VSVAAEVSTLAPTLGFLAAVLVLGHLCAQAGLFAAAGRLLADGAGGRARRLLALVFALAAAVTAVLGLDATVVLLTPVVLSSALAQKLPPRPHLYACLHLANAASLLLPVSNLTNLLVFHQSEIAFTRFALLMLVPWLVVIAVEWIVLRRCFEGELPQKPEERPLAAGGPPPPRHDGAPRLAAAVVAATLAGFVLSAPFGVDPAWIAAAGALVLAVPALASGRTSVVALVRAASPGFLLLVLGLGLLVAVLLSFGLDDLLDEVVPRGDGFLPLLGVAAFAALLANAINNLPATLILLPALADRGTGPALAALIGLNVGPNLTYTGSLATLLWKRQLRGSGEEPSWPLFRRLGLLTVPPALLLATAALWAGLQVV
jgi:arsenical pump membrane protein